VGTTLDCYPYSVPDSTVVQDSLPMRLPEELLEKSGFLLVRLAMGFKARAIDELEAAGFSQYHYSVLAVLGEQARKTQSTIADALGLDPSQLVGVLDGLEDRGLIVRQRDPNDRRRHVVSLTGKGRTQLVRLRTRFDRLEDELFTPLDAQTRKNFHEILLRLAAHHDHRCATAPPSE
jgi:MarR family transcriptional regulator, lower aerobic nicotinate degradation pathway regulator